jgi:hypothetical protein
MTGVLDAPFAGVHGDRPGCIDGGDLAKVRRFVLG